MPKIKGKKIPERSERLQEVYEQIGDRLLIDSPKQLAEEFDVSSALIRNWRSRRRKKIQRKLAKAQDNLTIYSECKQAQLTPVLSNPQQRISDTEERINNSDTQEQQQSKRNDERNDEKGDLIKGIYLDQAIASRTYLDVIRGKVGGGLTEIHEGLLTLINQLKTHINEETLTPGECKVVAATLSDISDTLTKLNLLPYGHTKLAALKFSDSIPPQHLHLHSHGSRRQPKALDVVDVDVVEMTTAPASEELSSAQATMVSEL